MEELELALGNEVGFSVVPLSGCAHCAEIPPLKDDVPSSTCNGLAPVFEFDPNAPCQECGAVGENMQCLICREVHCGRHVKKHMLAHHEATKHPLVVGFADLSFWCYACDSYIKETNPHLQPIYDQLCLAKFGGEG